MPENSRRRTWRGWALGLGPSVLSLAAHDARHRAAWAVGVFLAVYAIGLAGLLREGEGWLRAAYGSLQLFGVNGSASWLRAGPGRNFVVAAAFVAPFITLSLLGLIVARFVDLLRRMPIATSDHVVIIGGGRVGFQWVKAFQGSDSPPSRIVVVDPTPDANVLEMELASSARKGPRCVTLQMDARSKDARSMCRFDRARAVVVCTGNDVGNIELASGIYSSASGPQVFCRVDAPDLLVTRPSDTGIRYFSFYHWVARRTVRQVMPRSSGGEAGQAVNMVIAGFGRFGQAVLTAALQEHGPNLGRVTVVDRNADDLLEAFRFAAPGLWDAALGRAVARQQNLLNSQLWNDLRPAPDGPPLHVWLCTDSDRTNLTWAASLRRRFTEAARCVVICRQTDDPPTPDRDIYFASFRTSDISTEINSLISSPKPHAAATDEA